MSTELHVDNLQPGPQANFSRPLRRTSPQSFDAFFVCAQNWKPMRMTNVVSINMHNMGADRFAASCNYTEDARRIVRKKITAGVAREPCCTYF